MKSMLLRFVPPVAVFFAVGFARSQEVPRDQYIKYVPLSHPRLVQQTFPSEEMRLYGDRDDPAYRDVNPVDGIDDERYAVLMLLAVRFAPYLVQNTTNIPTNFDIYIGNAASFRLHVDTWDMTGVEPRLIETEGIDFSALGRASGSIDDSKLLDLLDRFSPHAVDENIREEPRVRPRQDVFRVMYFDFPGEGPDTWEEAYRPEYEKTPEQKRRHFPYSYVHPFLARVDDDPGSPAGYDFVLQYWFFYPSNDGGNNHEGDWEHINVVVAPRSMVESPLSRETVEHILNGALPATDGAADPLVIRRTEYYFHHFVMTLDYSSPNAYLPRNEWKESVNRRSPQWLQEDEIWKAIRRMAYVDDEETEVNTHPFGYIGADNKGFDQAMAAPGGKNRNSHGTFPFPGRYRSIGPAGATEQITVDVDSRRYLRRLREGRETTGPEFKRGHVLGLADPDRLRIVPDWERVIALARADAGARREWSWLVLPILWGYPATESPFSGILDHADTGNLPPVGPSFSSGWNVSGPASGFHAYVPHRLPSVFPLGLQDGFRNDLGFLNLTIPVLFNVPPLDFMTRVASYPIKQTFGGLDPIYYPKESVPFRFLGLSSGVSTQIFDDDFRGLAFNPVQLEEFALQLLSHYFMNGGDSSTIATRGADFKTNSVGAFYEMAFYIGDRFTSENMVRNMRSTFGTTVEFNNIPPYTYSAEIDYWEYAGSFRYSISSSYLQPFLKAGYGWSWYRLENVRANDELFDQPESDWISPKSIWPNVWHLGLGIEYVPWKRVGIFPGGVDVAFRFEYGWYTQNLGLDLSGIPVDKLGLFFDTLGDVPGNERVARHDFLFGATLSF